MRHVMLYPVALLAAALAANPAHALDVSTGFETIDTIPGEVFTVGTVPIAAEFSGNAWSGVAGNFALYHTGTHAWMVLGGGTGTIQFLTPASRVEFWSRTDPGAFGTTVITAFDPTNAPIGSVTLTAADAWQLIVFQGSVDRVEVANNDGLMNSVDDFGFDVAPCELAVNPTYAAGTLDMEFTLGLTGNGEWNLWISVGNGIFPLATAVALPTPIDPAVTFSIPTALAPLGKIGILTTITDGGEIICSDWKTVDTGL